MEQVGLCDVWPTENWLGSTLNHIQGWMTVCICLKYYIRAEMKEMLSNRMSDLEGADVRAPRWWAAAHVVTFCVVVPRPLVFCELHVDDSNLFECLLQQLIIHQ